MGNHVFEGRSPTAYLKERGMPSRTGGILLCYGACPHCGWWCACPEGGLWPDCPNCGGSSETIKPFRLPADGDLDSFDPRRYVDEPGGAPKAFVGFFMLEGEALEFLRRPQGITDPRPTDQGGQSP